MNRAQRRHLKKHKKGVVKMESNQRSIDDIRVEYNNTLAQLGDKDFRKAVLESEIGLLRVKLSDLNKEAAAVPAIIPEVVDEPSISKAE